MSTADTPPAERVAVIGGGLMGTGIAQVMATAGLEVIVHDPIPDALARVPERIAANGANVTVALDSDLEHAVARADWVFEAAPENLELKQDLFQRIDAATPPGTVIASNSSVMRVGDIAARATNRERILGTHWWNPPFLVPLVEVVQGADTDPAVVDRTIAFLRRLGKTAVHVKRDVAGFVGNRLQHALWREAFDLIDTGVCDPETVDVVIKASFGNRLGVMGPVENADYVGLDLTLAIHDYVLPTLNPPSEPSTTLREHVARGELGAKSGSGFRDWDPGEADAVRERLLAHLTRSTS